MIIEKLTKHNINNLCINIPVQESMGIAGLSGSGKTTFCKAITDEYKRRIISLLTKTDRDFLFKDIIKTDFGTLGLKELPAINFFHQDGVIISPRSTIGTHTGIFKTIRRLFANKYNLSIQFFSYNNLTECNKDIICGKCKGRGTFGGNLCPQCLGARYTSLIQQYTITVNNQKYSLLDLFQMPIENLQKIMDSLAFQNKDKQLINAICSMELGYLSLDRTFGTLSGGEITRIQLAEAISSSKQCLIIVDELSYGLDSKTLENVLSVVSDLGQDNVIWFIDHSDLVLNATSNKLFFGPKSGCNGGKVIDYSPRPKEVLPAVSYSIAKGYLSFSNLHCRNINLSSFEIPQNCIVAISGKSGCGKSTLMRECILPSIAKRMPDLKTLVVEQNKAKMVSKTSTLATFLGISSIISQRAKVSKTICHYCFGSGINDNGGSCVYCSGTGIDSKFFQSVYSNKITVGELYNLTIAELLDRLNQNDPIYSILKDIDFLGISHLSLSRSIRTLSAGEYQALYLVSCLNSLQNGKEYFLFLDEPTKGLSQNIINQLMIVLRKLQDQFNITIVYIEHTSYMLRAADYVIDFGQERSDNVTSLSCTSHEEWDDLSKTPQCNYPIVRSNYMHLSNMHTIDEQGKADQVFQRATNQFYSSIKEFSDTANWIYSSFDSDDNIPTIPIDFARTLYSSGTRLWEIGNVISHIVSFVSGSFKQAELFDFRNPLNLCLSCKGTGLVNSIDFTKCFVKPNESWNTGLFEDDVYSALRNYNFSRVSKMFQGLKIIRGLDLSKSFSAMSDEEKDTLMYGDWNYQLPGKEDRTYIWRGFNFLVQKYMRESSSPMKQILKDSLREITCPICHGRTLRHRESLLYNDKDIFEYLTMPIGKCINEFPQISILKCIRDICGDDVSLYNDISKMNKGIQVICKLFDLYSTQLVGFHIYLKNIPQDLPQYAKTWLFDLAKNNSISICSTIQNSVIPLSKLFPTKKCSDTTLVFQLLGFKNVDKEIRLLKKTNKCPACNGKGNSAVTTDNDNINCLSEICSQCLGSGIATSAQQNLIAGIPVKSWIEGDMHALLPDKFPEGVYLPVLKKLSELDQGQLELLAKRI